MQEKKTQNPSLPVTHETLHGNQWKRTQKQRGEPQCAGNPSHTESVLEGPPHLDWPHPDGPWRGGGCDRRRGGWISVFVFSLIEQLRQLLDTFKDQRYTWLT